MMRREGLEIPIQVDTPSGMMRQKPVGRVLVIEESSAVRKRLVEILSLCAGGVEIHAASTSRAGWELFQRARPTLVLMELVGEDPNEGLSLLRAMMEADDDLRIILVTSEDVHGPLVRKAIRYGTFSVVAKPLRHERIRQVLAEIDNETGLVARLR